MNTHTGKMTKNELFAKSKRPGFGIRFVKDLFLVAKTTNCFRHVLFEYCNYCFDNRYLSQASLYFFAVGELNPNCRKRGKPAAIVNDARG
jgi:hypothetical protein